MSLYFLFFLNMHLQIVWQQTTRKLQVSVLAVFLIVSGRYIGAVMIMPFGLTTLVPDEPSIQTHNYQARPTDIEQNLKAKKTPWTMISNTCILDLKISQWSAKLIYNWEKIPKTTGKTDPGDTVVSDDHTNHFQVHYYTNGELTCQIKKYLLVE